MKFHVYWYLSNVFVFDLSNVSIHSNVFFFFCKIKNCRYLATMWLHYKNFQKTQILQLHCSRAKKLIGVALALEIKDAIFTCFRHFSDAIRRDYIGPFASWSDVEKGWFNVKVKILLWKKTYHFFFALFLSLVVFSFAHEKNNIPLRHNIRLNFLKSFFFTVWETVLKFSLKSWTLLGIIFIGVLFFD